MVVFFLFIIGIRVVYLNFLDLQRFRIWASFQLWIPRMQLINSTLDSEYLDVFIATHKSWIKSLELLKFLINVFYNPTPRTLTSNNTLAQEEKLIQLRYVFCVL